MGIKLRIITRMGMASVALAVSDLGRLLWRLTLDQRVPTQVRLGLAGVAVYVISPVDLIPAWIPFAGQVDDAIVTVVGIRTLLRRVPEPLLLEHWSGDMETLERIMGRPIGVSPAVAVQPPVVAV